MPARNSASARLSPIASTRTRTSPGPGSGSGTSLGMDGVARESGLGRADSLRQHLLRRTGLTPSAYRSSFSRLAGTRTATAGTGAPAPAS